MSYWDEYFWPGVREYDQNLRAEFGSYLEAAPGVAESAFDGLGAFAGWVGNSLGAGVADFFMGRNSDGWWSSAEDYGRNDRPLDFHVHTDNVNVMARGAADTANTDDGMDEQRAQAQRQFEDSLGAQQSEAEAGFYQQRHEQDGGIRR